MSKFFYHDGEINTINKHFPLYLKKTLKELYKFNGTVSIEKLSAPHVKRSGDNELRISENVIKITGKKDVKFTYIENFVSAELTIKVEENPIYLINKMSGITKDGLTLAKDIGRAVIDEVIKA